MKDLNLLPQAVLQQRRKNEIANFIMLGLLVISIASVLYALISFMQVKIFEGKRQTLVNKFNAFSNVNEEYKKLKALEEQYNFKSGILTSLEEKEKLIKDTLEFLENYTPANVSYGGITLNGSSGLVLPGTASDMTAVADLIYYMRETKKFNKVFVGSVSAPTGVNKGVSFSINLE